MKKGLSWFAAFTAVFAVCAAFAFWGTWSPDVVPVMPDCSTNFSGWSDSISGFFRNWVNTGKFVPDDLKVFLASPWIWVELQYVFAAFMAALGMAYFLKGKGLSDLACYGAGLFLAFSGYWFSLFSAGHLGWFRWMTYGVFAFGLIDRAIEKGGLKYWLLLGACVAWGSFYQPDLWLLFTVFTGIYFLFRAWSGISSASGDSRKSRLSGLGKGVAVAAVVFLAIGAPSFYSAFFVDLAHRDEQIGGKKAGGDDDKAKGAGQSSEERWIFVTNWSLPPNEIAEAFIPGLNGDTSCVLTQSLGAKAGTGVKPYTGAIGRPLNAPSGNYRQHSLYIGFITCLFALFGIRRAKFFAVAAVVFAALACGRYLEPVYRVVFALPFGDYLRAPVKWYHLFEFCVVVLAGFGIESVFRMLSTSRAGNGAGAERKWVLPVLAAVILIGAFDLVRVDHRFCAPVDMSTAKAKNAEMQMTFMHRNQFNDPQVANMVQAGLIKSLAYVAGNRDYYLVGVLRPRGPKKDEPMPPWTLPTWLGLVSVVTTVLVGAYSCRETFLKR